MAGSMKDIKLRIKSVESTMQITKAMELVASSKMRRAKERVEYSRPYFETLYESLRHTDGVIAVNRNSNRGTHHAEQIKIHDFFVGQIFYVRMRSSVSDVVGNAVEKIVVL